MGRKTGPLLTNTLCCQLLPNLQRTHRDKELLFLCTDLFLLLPAPRHNQDPWPAWTLSSQGQALPGQTPHRPAEQQSPQQSKGPWKHPRFTQLQSFNFGTPHSWQQSDSMSTNCGIPRGENVQHARPRESPPGRCQSRAAWRKLGAGPWPATQISSQKE